MTPKFMDIQTDFDNNEVIFHILQKIIIFAFWFLYGEGNRTSGCSLCALICNAYV